MKKITLVFLLITTACADDWLARFEAECRSRGGKPEHYASGGGRCVMPSGTSSSSSSTTNAYTPMVDELLKFLFSSNGNSAAKQRAAMVQALENERRAAAQRQESQRVQQLDLLMQRLLGGGDLALKGVDSDKGQLPLKFGGDRRRLGMEVYQHPDDGKKRMGISGLSGINLDNETPTTTKAQLSLKLGAEATQSMQPANVPAAASAPATPPSQEPETAELVRLLAQLTPEQQRSLLNEARNVDRSGAGEPSVSHNETGPPLALKLKDAQDPADALRASAATASPEEAKYQGEKNFSQLQTVHAAQQSSGPTPTAGSAPPMPPSPAGCGGGTNADSGTVDLSCAQHTAPALLRKAEPAKKTPEKTHAPEAGSRQWPGPKNPDPYLRNPLWDKPGGQSVSQKESGDELLATLNRDSYYGNVNSEKDLPALTIPAAPGRADILSGIASQMETEGHERALADFYAALDDVYAAKPGTKATAEQRASILAYVSPLSPSRYYGDREFARQVDWQIDTLLMHYKDDRAADQGIAYDRNFEKMQAVFTRFAPTGAQMDFATLRQNPQFVAERDQVSRGYDQELSAIRTHHIAHFYGRLKAAVDAIPAKK